MITSLAVMMALGQGGALAVNLVDVDGKVVLLRKQKGATVFVFLNRECPVSNALQPELARLQKKFDGAGVGFVGIYTDPDITNALAKAHAKSFKAKYHIILDPRHVLAKDYGAKVTPEAILLDSKSQAVYRGRINDLYAALGKRRQSATTHDLSDAITATLAGKRPQHATIDAVGCVIGPGAR